MNVAKVFNGVLHGGIYWVDDGTVLGPECVPAVYDPKPTPDPATQKVIPGPTVVENGGTSVRGTWQVIPLTADEIADATEIAQFKAFVQELKTILAKMKAGTATVADRNEAIEKVTRFVVRYLTNQGPP